MASDWDALLVDDAWDDRPYDPDDRAAFDDEPLDSLVMEARDRLNCSASSRPRRSCSPWHCSSSRPATRILDPTAGYIGALLLGASAGLMATMLFWLVVFARHRRIAYRGDWARAIRRGGWVFLVTALFVVLRLNKVFSPEIGLFILALVAVAEATLSVER